MIVTLKIFDKYLFLKHWKHKYFFIKISIIYDITNIMYYNIITTLVFVTYAINII